MWSGNLNMDLFYVSFIPWRKQHLDLHYSTHQIHAILSMLSWRSPTTLGCPWTSSWLHKYCSKSLRDCWNSNHRSLQEPRHHTATLGTCGGRSSLMPEYLSIRILPLPKPKAWTPTLLYSPGQESNAWMQTLWLNYLETTIHCRRSNTTWETQSRLQRPGKWFRVICQGIPVWHHHLHWRADWEWRKTRPLYTYSNTWNGETRRTGLL